ncbi:hypothetical protein L6164_000675 [Bauhinia variegata]|uniref:Uncharacterized protein n=1 Tax=Bauhinia variegata TaxID=167791 RepID=A0ACB9Q7U0_BAUVA|nr:hypothetical protein L6164_000675 [Bauhinia variegata]
MGSQSPVTNPTKFAGPDSLCHRIINISEIEPFLPSDCCIYEVPINLRQVNEKAYTPLLISIGPLHHGKKEFSKMEKQKEMYFQFFSKRLPKEDLEKYEAYLGDEKTETQIRSCYSEKHDDIKKQDFVRMILLDSVFIMELFLRNLKSKKEVENDCIFTKPWISKTIQRDLLLLENQLPIIVLKELYGFVPGGEKGEYGNFLELAHVYFESFDPMKSLEEAVPDDAKNNHRTNACCELFHHEYPQRQDKNLKNWEKSIHFTDLIRHLYLPPIELKVKPSLDVLRNAMKLNEAGITFEKLTGTRLLDIKFKKERFSHFLCLSCLPYFTCFKARFQIPQLKVDHTTECVLRNLIAFEQCHYPETPYICNYVSLIDSLIHTTDDVELLVETKVLVHQLGSHKELATLVNGLCKHVVTNATCYSDIISVLNQHYKSIWNRSMAALRLVYFRDPWRSSSTLVGIVIVVFAVFQFWRVIRSIFGHK